jgi:carboxypeptidase Taq
MQDTRLLTLSKELQLLGSVQAVLSWDQETYIPNKSHAYRGDQISYLSSLIHSKQTHTEIKQAIETVLSQFSLGTNENRLARVVERNYDLATKLPVSFVEKKSKLISGALEIWGEARKQNNFTLFEQTLGQIIEMTKQECEYYGYQKTPYNALLNLYSEGLTTDSINPNFDILKTELPKLIESQQPVKDIHFKISVAQQQVLTERLLKGIGMNFEQFRQDSSRHPFSTTLGPHDHRVTNKFTVDDIGSIWSGLHEGGHAMYEQGISGEFAGTDLGSNLSLIVHESQSRFWEKIIGFSDEYWQANFELVQPFITTPNITVEQFIKWVRRVKPGLIRIESDELCYDLHVIIRYEIEQLIFTNQITVSEIPEVWNHLYKKYLGVDVPDVANGCLQDIHWAHGSFGYFPTYSLGNIFSSQVLEAYKQFDSEFDTTVRSGNLGKIADWLKTKIHSHGSSLTPEQIITSIDQNRLNPAAYISRLKARYL